MLILVDRLNMIMILVDQLFSLEPRYLLILREVYSNTKVRLILTKSHVPLVKTSCE